MAKIIVIVLIVLIISSAGALASYNIAKYFEEKDNNPASEITTFDECVNSPNPTLAAGPIRCIDYRGNVYYQQMP